MHVDMILDTGERPCNSVSATKAFTFRYAKKMGNWGAKSLPRKLGHWRDSKSVVSYSLAEGVILKCQS